MAREAVGVYVEDLRELGGEVPGEGLSGRCDVCGTEKAVYRLKEVRMHLNLRHPGRNENVIGKVPFAYPDSSGDVCLHLFKKLRFSSLFLLKR